MKKPGKTAPEKRAYNVYMEADLADYLRDRFPNMGARIMTELSRKMNYHDYAASRIEVVSRFIAI